MGGQCCSVALLPDVNSSRDPDVLTNIRDGQTSSKSDGARRWAKPGNVRTAVRRGELGAKGAETTLGLAFRQSRGVRDLDAVAPDLEATRKHTRAQRGDLAEVGPR